MRLSKSKVLEYERCPYAFKLHHIDGFQEPPSMAMQRGSEIHQIYDDFFKPPTSDLKELSNEITKHELFPKYKTQVKKLLSLTEKTGVPLYREVKLYDEVLNISGIIDRVDFDGKSIAIIDYKSGQEHPIENYRFELALYTYLFEKNHNQKVTHWGIFFIDKGKMVMEKKDFDEVLKAIDKVKEVRQKIKNEEFPKCGKRWCICQKIK